MQLQGGLRPKAGERGTLYHRNDTGKLEHTDESMLLDFWEQVGKAAASDGKSTAEPTVP